MSTSIIAPAFEAARQQMLVEFRACIRTLGPAVARMEAEATLRVMRQIIEMEGARDA